MKYIIIIIIIIIVEIDKKEGKFSTQATVKNEKAQNLNMSSKKLTFETLVNVEGNVQYKR